MAASAVVAVDGLVREGGLVGEGDTGPPRVAQGVDGQGGQQGRSIPSPMPLVTYSISRSAVADQS